MVLKNKYKISVRFADGGHKDFFIDSYIIDNHGFIVFEFNGKKKSYHVSNVDIEEEVNNNDN